MTHCYRQARGALTAEPKDIGWQSAQDQEARAPTKARREKEKDQKEKVDGIFQFARSAKVRRV